MRCKKTAELIIDFPGDKEWSLNVLGSFVAKFDLTHPYFAKDYVKPRTIELEEDLNDGLVPNLNQYFDGLPEPINKKK